MVSTPRNKLSITLIAALSLVTLLVAVFVTAAGVMAQTDTISEIDLSSLQPITIENASQITELAQLDTRQPDMARGYALVDMALSPDSRTLATRYTDIEVNPTLEDDALQFWDVETLALKGVLRGHSDTFIIGFSPDGGLLGYWDRQAVGLWEIAAETVTHSWNSNGLPAVGSFSPNGQLFAFPIKTSEANAVLIWNIETGAEYTTLDQPDASEMLFSPDSNQLAIADQGGVVKLWYLGTGETSEAQLIYEPQGFSLGILDMMFTPSGQRLIFADPDNQLHIWGIAENEQIAVLETVDEDAFWFRSSSSSYGTIFAYEENATTRLLNVETGENLLELPLSEGTILGINSDETIIAIRNISNEADSITLNDVQTGNDLATLLSVAPGTYSVPLEFSADGRYITGLVNAIIYFWGIPLN